MNWGTGHIDSWWDDSFKELNYINKPIPNQHDIPRWENEYGKGLSFIGGVYDMSQPLPSYAAPFLSMMKNWTNVGITFFKLDSLQALPLHKDTYTKFQEIYKITDLTKIWRCVVFLEDWKSGHYLEVNGTAIVNWKRGDYTYWQYDVEHYAGNFGTEPRYTLQITGIVND